MSPETSAGILVVEDYPDHLTAVCELLEEEGYRVDGAANGSVALDRLLHGTPPDLILVDLVMPVMDGWRFVAEVKSRPALAAIPIVVISGGGVHILSSAPVSAGYLEKPIHRQRLLQTVAACLERRGRAPPGSHPVQE